MDLGEEVTVDFVITKPPETKYGAVPPLFASFPNKNSRGTPWDQ